MLITEQKEGEKTGGPASIGLKPAGCACQNICRVFDKLVNANAPLNSTRSCVMRITDNNGADL